ncbi:hypothetical protein LE181_09015 [Streptomyces sp. SCA3-4]|uniref:hypothetical protein n=1 Tax=Streptomyces sichuanensis TaxID=2871810 RepID=UPI001CE33747|nr:hypothetical protein [Streptomyces sichuanensis]MCA6092300.1 hypothetical protein [Streptomyces sichuanensis]
MCRHHSGRSAINRIRRTVAAAVTGILLSIGSVAVATPAHADSELAKLLCAAFRTGYAKTQPQACEELE